MQLERALELSADMQRRGVQRNVHTHSALMNVCIKCGQLKLALDVWEDMQRDGIVPNVVSPCARLQRTSNIFELWMSKWRPWTSPGAAIT